MAKKRFSKFAWLVFVLLAVGIYLQVSHPTFAVLPPNRCISINNINTNVISDNNGAFNTEAFLNPDAWITIDVNGDGIKEKFGYVGTSESGCIESSSSFSETKKVALVSSAGDSLYYFHNLANAAVPKTLTLCHTIGSGGPVYQLDAGNSGAALSTCGSSTTVTPINVNVTTCTPNWQSSSWSECLSGQQFRTVSDLNSCSVDTGKPTLAQECTMPGTGSGISTTTWIIIGVIGLFVVVIFMKK